MGALEMGLKEEELQPLVDSWRTANPNIVRFWWDVDRAVKKAVKQREPSVLRGIRFEFVENIVQAISRDILCYAMRTLSHCRICAHVHDELIIECRKDASLDAICEQMGRTPPWADGLVLRADGYETQFYKKD